MFDSESYVDLNVIVGNPLGSNVRYPDSVGNTFCATLEVLPAGSVVNFPSPTSGGFLFLFSIHTFCYSLWVLNYYPLVAWAQSGLSLVQRQ